MPKASKKQPSKPMIILQAAPGTARIVGKGHIITNMIRINPIMINVIFFISRTSTNFDCYTANKHCETHHNACFSLI